MPVCNIIHYLPGSDFSKPVWGPLEIMRYEGNAAWVSRPANHTLPLETSLRGADIIHQMNIVPILFRQQKKINSLA